MPRLLIIQATGYQARGVRSMPRRLPVPVSEPRMASWNCNMLQRRVREMLACATPAGR